MMRQVFWLILVKGLPDSTVALSLTLPGGRIHSYGDSTGFICITPDFPFDSFRKPYQNKIILFFKRKGFKLLTSCEEHKFVTYAQLKPSHVQCKKAELV